jgi:RHS repeat-associated protein
MAAGITYTIKLRWKANKADPGTIWAGAGPIGGQFSPTRLTAQLEPNSAQISSVASTQQYTLTASDGNTWADLDATHLATTITPTTDSSAILSANADLWTSSTGYNQDIGIWVSGGSYGSGQLVAWKESGGFAGTNSPNAAFVHAVIPMAAGITYTIKLRWKANKADPGTIWAGAGPIGGQFSPTRLTAQLEPTGAAQPPDTYAYTPLNQLSTVNNSSYAYDAADNLTQLTSGGTLSYNTADEAKTLTQSSTTTQFGYDLRGNRITGTPSSGPGTGYTYDQANRLTSYANGSTTAAYVYNAGGLRMTRTVGAVTSQEAWDVSGGLPVLLTDGSANYVYGPGGLPLEQIAATGVNWYHHDQLGSTRVITDSTGAVVATYAYDPYGNSTSSTGTLTNPFQFSGEYRDSESGLYYLRARYYDPTTAQFLSLDPIGSKTRSPYAYVSGNPLNGTDPSGLYVGIQNPDAPIVYYDKNPYAIWPGRDDSDFGPTLQGISGVAGGVSAAAGGVSATCAGLAVLATASWIGSPLDVLFGPCAAASGVVSLGAAGVQTASDIGLAVESQGNPENLALDAFGGIVGGQGALVGHCLEGISEAAKYASDAFHNLVGSGIPLMKPG